MKKILFLFFILASGLCFGQRELTTPSGHKYKLWDECRDCPLVVYLPGKDENINISIFVTKWVPANKSKFVIATPYFVSGKSGWQWEISPGTFSGTAFFRYVKYNHPNDGRAYGTGFSAGSDYDVWAALGNEVTAVAMCAGSGDNYNNVVLWAQSGVPVRHYHGTSDGAPGFTSPNNFKLGQKTAISWFQNTGLGKMEFIEIPNGGHSSAPARAYDPAGDLATWFLSYPKNPVPVPIDDPVLKAYFRESEGKLIIKTESGKTLRFTPD